MNSRIVRLHYGFAMALRQDIEDTRKAGRMSYEYDVETPTGVRFIGSQYRPSLMAKDDTEILDGLLAYICLRPGDTDKEYFDSYTPEQLEWTNSIACETMNFVLSDW